ncbi:UNVERIFIED_CONTAM: dual specificity protein kinase kns1 [Siphonaria sp. JEL0065]|nr:dual specificity protein kinase kns1 [Siphonaria sp. JEL0065]
MAPLPPRPSQSIHIQVIETIDLTQDTPSPLLQPAGKKRRMDYGYPVVAPAASGMMPPTPRGSGMDGRRLPPLQPLQHHTSLPNPHPFTTVSDVSVVAPLVECDDKDGHYIIREGDDLTPRYKIIRLLGQGTFGKVVEAFDRTRNTKVAIKIIRSIQKYRDAAKVEVRVLTALKKHDPMNLKQCIHLLSYFEHKNHTCMVFELLAQSIFDFLKDNSFSPFPMLHIQQFSNQILGAITFMHGLRLIHTDLKPENLMLESNVCRPHMPGKNNARELASARLRLIDFGSAIFDEDYHSSVVSTRHYRAPEIILGLGWTFPCDMWSIGCILVEFFTGDALFQTHDNVEHLAMMQAVLGPIPQHIIKSITPEKSSAKFFKPNRQVNWPVTATPKTSKKFVKNMKTLEEIIPPINEQSRLFLDLVKKLLVYDPKQRITAREALQHPFLRCPIQ